MSTLKVDNLAFSFRRNLWASKYDEWKHHQKLLGRSSRKAMDAVAVQRTTDPPDCWLIEAKDFRFVRGIPNEKNGALLPDTVASKARDTLEGLKDAALNAEVEHERALAQLARKAARVRVVLHLEPYTGAPSKLFPVNPNPANIQQKLKQLTRDLDPNPLVLSISTTAKANVPWTVS